MTMNAVAAATRFDTTLNLHFGLRHSGRGKRIESECRTDGVVVVVQCRLVATEDHMVEERSRSGVRRAYGPECFTADQRQRQRSGWMRR